MQACVRSAPLSGLEAVLVRVEVAVTSGLPSDTTVGLPASTMRQVCGRVRLAAARPTPPVSGDL